MASNRPIVWFPFRAEVSRSQLPFGRFSIAVTTSGFTVVDHASGDVRRTETLGCAQAWANLRYLDASLPMQPHMLHADSCLGIRAFFAAR